MKKIVLLIMAICLYANAAYFDIGVGTGFGGIGSSVVDVEENCNKDCSNGAFEYGARIGASLGQKFVLAGEFDGMMNAFADDDNYMLFNSFFVGPSVIFYPTNHLQLSTSFGYAWTANATNYDEVRLPEGDGIGMSLTVAYDTGSKIGALIGGKFYMTVVGDDRVEDATANVGFLVFARFVNR